MTRTPTRAGVAETGSAGPLLALVSAGLFGASTPLAKLLIGAGVSPWLLASMLYLGSGLGLGVFALARRGLGRPRAEAPLRLPDLPRLALVVLSGGVAGPVLLMVGLRSTPASSAALLLNLEGLATLLIAWLAFRESVDRRLLVGAGAILGGAVLLSWSGGPHALGPGALAIAGACLCWGVDNNLTRKLSSADPVQIAAAKGLAAGTMNLLLALWAGARAPAPPLVAWAATIGFFGYGVSVVLYMLALRRLGAARTGAYFSTAPFLGALLGLGLLREPVTPILLAAAALMALGVYLHLSERHAHEHAHEDMEHEHRHVHDAHHQHAHRPDDPPGEPHTHRHRHPPLSHSHAHYPDLHHRHRHAS